MKYNKFIHVNENFSPVFDLENETDNEWLLFIPNDKFRDILSSAIDSLDVTKDRNPIWLQGTYGTGKSHATSVIKHLLCDEDIHDFDLDQPQLSAKLESFREKNNVFPVVIKGTSTIGTPEKFRSTIQTAVKNALNENNKRVSVDSDFEHMISLIDSDLINIQEEHIKGTKLEAFPIEEIEKRLENKETDILIELEKILNQSGVNPFVQINVVEWLKEVQKELKEKYDIDYLMIFWDEFTGALNQPNVEDILLEIQNIAEAKEFGISLFIVSHRTRSSQMDINEEKIEKILDRFERKYYSMEPIATYELMERSIKKDNEWNEYKDRFLEKIRPLINKISLNEGPKVKNALINLYPIHPYTAYLATFIAQEIGSTERSIFKFLHDNTDYGFKNFIDNIDVEERYFLTSEYLWDFFYDDFDQKEDEKISSAIKKFKLHRETLNNEGDEYEKIFKVVLLLNILYKIAEVGKESLAIPTRDNINNVFIGSIYEDDVDKVLDYIDNNGIINETPDHLFELTTNALPQDKVSQAYKKIMNNIKLIDLLDSRKIENIKNSISSKVIRDTEIEVRDASIQKNRLISDLEKGIFKADGHLHMILFIPKTDKELLSIKDIVESVSNEGHLKDTIIAISENSFKESNLKQCIEFKARAKVAREYSYTEDIKLNEDYADKRIQDWVNKIKYGLVSWYYDAEKGKANFSTLYTDINENLSMKLFSKGLENIEETRTNKNFWKTTNAKSQAERFLNASNYQDLREILGNNWRTLAIFNTNTGQKIVDENLILIDECPDSHPIKLIQEFVDEKLTNAQRKGKFNLGRELKPLLEPPYGLYPNLINIGALAFTLRKYVKKLYDDKGNSINANRMKDYVVNIFDYWSKDKKEEKLYVRFGSEEETQLIELIIKIFGLEVDPNEQSIDVVRWQIRHWIKSKKAPLWLFKYSDDATDTLKDLIETLSILLKNDDENHHDEIVIDSYDKLKANRFDFESLIYQDVEVLFNNLILSVSNVSKEKILTIKEYLFKSFPEEVDSWDEDIARNKISSWINLDVDKTRAYNQIENMYLDIIKKLNTSELKNTEELKNKIDSDFDGLRDDIKSVMQIDDIQKVTDKAETLKTENIAKINELLDKISIEDDKKKARDHIKMALSNVLDHLRITGLTNQYELNKEFNNGFKSLCEELDEASKIAVVEEIVDKSNDLRTEYINKTDEEVRAALEKEKSQSIDEINKISNNLLKELENCELEDTDELKENIKADFNESCEAITKSISFNGIGEVMKEVNDLQSKYQDIIIELINNLPSNEEILDEIKEADSNKVKEVIIQFLRENEDMIKNFALYMKKGE